MVQKKDLKNSPESDARGIYPIIGSSGSVASGKLASWFMGYSSE